MALCVMMNKKGKIKHARSDHLNLQWTRQIFYLFMIIQRLRNPQNFTWWAMCNTAAHFGSKVDKISSFFGVCLSHTGMLEKLQATFGFEEVDALTKESLLVSGDFGIAIFDNSQFIQQLKYQRGGHSSLFTLCTSRCFVKVTIPPWYSDIKFPEEKVLIVYSCKQAIPSPHG